MTGDGPNVRFRSLGPAPGDVVEHFDDGTAEESAGATADPRSFSRRPPSRSPRRSTSGPRRSRTSTRRRRRGLRPSGTGRLDERLRAPSARRRDESRSGRALSIQPHSGGARRVRPALRGARPDAVAACRAAHRRAACTAHRRRSAHEPPTRRDCRRRFRGGHPEAAGAGGRRALAHRRGDRSRRLGAGRPRLGHAAGNRASPLSRGRPALQRGKGAPPSPRSARRRPAAHGGRRGRLRCRRQPRRQGALGALARSASPRPLPAPSRSDPSRQPRGPAVRRQRRHGAAVRRRRVGLRDGRRRRPRRCARRRAKRTTDARPRPADADRDQSRRRRGARGDRARDPHHSPGEAPRSAARGA